MKNILGRLAKDKLTGFQGRVVGTTQYLSGCNQVLLVPPIDKEGNYVEGRWFDEQRLDLIGEDRVVLDNKDTPGSDMAAPLK